MVGEEKNMGLGEPKRKKVNNTPKQNPVELAKLSSQQYKRYKDDWLTKKAHWMFYAVLTLFVVVYITGLFSKDETLSLVSEAVRIVSGILTFLLGFLFASSRGSQ